MSQFIVIGKYCSTFNKAVLPWRGFTIFYFFIFFRKRAITFLFYY